MKKILLLASAALVALASCSKVETISTAQPEEIGLRGYTIKPTKALYEGSLQEGSLGVYAHVNTGNKYFDNTEFAWNSDAFKAQKYWPKGKTLDFTVCYPYHATSTTLHSEFSLENGKITYNNVPATEDFLVGSEVIQGTKGKVAATLVHTKSLLTFTAKTASQDLEDNVKFIITQVDLSPIDNQGDVAITYPVPANIVWKPNTAGTNAGDLTLNTYGQGELTFVGAAINTDPVLIVPQNQVAFTIHYTMDGVEMEQEIAPEGMAKWEPGKKYTYNLTFNADQITFTATVTAWTATASENIDKNVPSA